MVRELPEETLLQYRALTEGVGLIDLRGHTWIEVSGDDRAAFVNGFCTNDVAGLEFGQGCEAFVTNVKGRVLAHVFVFSDRGVLTIDAVAGQAEQIITHLDRYIIREDVALRDRAQDGQVWLLGGARAERLLKDLADGDVPARPLCLAACEILGSRVSLRRVPILTGPAFVIACSGDDAARIEEAFTNAGVVRCGPAVGEIVRVEAGFPRYGQDISDDNLPQEVGRDAQAINFTKGCYLGQETVARLDALGHVNRLLCGLRWDAAGPPAAGAPLVVDQRIVGRITSSVWSPRIQAPLSLAYVRREHARVGTRLQTELGMAEVARLPLTEVGDQV